MKKLMRTLILISVAVMILGCGGSGEKKSSGDASDGASDFAALDTDGDGAVSPEEFGGDAEAFAALDTDENGSLSAVEFAANKVAPTDADTLDSSSSADTSADTNSQTPDILFVPADTVLSEVKEEDDLPADPMVCTGKVDGFLQYIGGACCYTAGWNPANPNCVWNAEDFGDGECLDNQCESNDCAGGRYCSRRCNTFMDVVNNATGEGGPDGVNDPGTSNDCIGAVDGPFGTDYQCVNLRNVVETSTKGPFAKCTPGSEFQGCKKNQDCPAGEICDMLYVHGAYQSRCMTADKEGAAGTEFCNEDPNAGSIARCKAPMCRGNSCVDFCEVNNDCASDTCDDGKCAKSGAVCSGNSDCSAWECQEWKPYSNNDFVGDFCREKSCSTAAGCPDPDWFCRPYWNGADKVEDVAFAPSCRRQEEDTVNYGEACGKTGDGSGLPKCVYNTACIDNYCGGPCKVDADCGAGAECLRGTEWDIDVDDDDVEDTWINLDLCQKWSHDGELTDCSDDGICPAGHHCRYRMKGAGEGAERSWNVEYKCRKDTDNDATFGEKCGSSGGGADCTSNLCLVGGGSDNAMCTATCSSASDCPEFVEFDGYTWKTLCLSFNVSHENTVDPSDDIYVPYCWRVSSIGSLDACDANLNCTHPKEYCRASYIAGNADEAVVVEHLCADMGENLTEYPTKNVGESCASWQECKGRSCLPDNTGGKYCSELCATDADCGTLNEKLRCSEQVLVPRKDKTLAGITHRCVIQETCVPCTSDDDCGGEFQCVNIGGLDDLADFRCGKPCTSGDDCTEDPSAVCHVDINAKGAPTGKKACLPIYCPSGSSE